MPSLIPGYEYDIFISYRQNDNRHDGWVTGFVSHLRAELEATFKEEVNVYFDLNPHDGLLDTHDVDETLREKLKCLIFLPVISRTYCDPRSFAWEHEFKAFIRQAAVDRLGLKVTLQSGNVTSRILPVRIHEIDQADRELIENETGGALRAIDFIYREPGVNRPLTPADDEHKNQNGTIYRNQINKTANAIREIISALQSDLAPVLKEKHGLKEPWEDTGISKTGGRPARRPAIPRGNRLLLLIAVLAGLAIVFSLVKFGNFRQTHGKPDGKSIAVLPFVYIGSDESNLWAGDALTEEVISKLCEINDLKVRPRTSVMRYREAAPSIPEIGKELGVSYIIEGSYQIFDESVRITVKLINARRDEQLWSNVFDGAWNELHSIQTDIAIKTATSLQAVLTPEEKARIRKDPTGSPDAYRNYLSANVLSENALFYLLSGNKFVDSISFSEAISMYDKAIREDQAFALAYARRAIARSWGYHAGQLDPSHIEKCRTDAETALKLDSELAEAHVAMGFYNYYCIGDNNEAITHFSRAAELSPASYQPPFYLAMVYRKMGNWARSQELIRKVIDEDPRDALVLLNIGISYSYMHSFDTAISFFQKATEAMPYWSGPYTSLLETWIMKDGNTIRAREVLDTLIARTGEKHQYYRVMLDFYDRKYNAALLKLMDSEDADFGFPGLRYLLTGMVSGFTGNAEMTQRYYDSALVLYKQIVMNNPEDYYSHSSRGLAFAGLGNKTEAEIAGETAVKLAGNDNLVKTDMIANLAKIYAINGDKANAVREIKYLLSNPSWFSTGILAVDPTWGSLAKEPEIRSLIRK